MGDVVGNPDLLRIGRQLRGLQQGEAAARLGITQSMLSRAENRLVQFGDDLVGRAAQGYGLPASFFVQPDTALGAPVSVHPMWRKKASVTAREMDQIIAELNLRAMHLRRMLQAVEIEATYTVPSLPPDEYGGSVERVAAMTRAHWQMPSGPVFDLVGHLEAAGIVVARSPMAGSAVDGVTFAAPGLPPLILLNAGQPADRMRFSLAHELAHLVMHRGQPTPAMEDEANTFARCFLLPPADVRPYFEGRRVDLRLLAELKPLWRVSMASLLMCARKLEIIDENQARYLWQQFSMRKYRQVEPPELDFPHERPKTVSELLEAHVEQLGYSVNDLAGVLHVHGDELRTLYEMPGNVVPAAARLRLVK